MLVWLLVISLGVSITCSTSAYTTDEQLPTDDISSTGLYEKQYLGKNRYGELAPVHNIVDSLYNQGDGGINASRRRMTDEYGELAPILSAVKSLYNQANATEKRTEPSKSIWPDIAWKKWLIIAGLILLGVAVIASCIGCCYWAFKIYLMKMMVEKVTDKFAGKKSHSEKKHRSEKRV